MDNVVVCRQTWIHLWDCLDKCCCNGCHTEVRLRFKQLVMCPLSTSVQFKSDDPHHNKEMSRCWKIFVKNNNYQTPWKWNVVNFNPSTLSVFVSVAWATGVVAILVVMMRCRIISCMSSEYNDMKSLTATLTVDISPQYIQNSIVSPLYLHCIYQ